MIMKFDVVYVWVYMFCSNLESVQSRNYCIELESDCILFLFCKWLTANWADSYMYSSLQPTLISYKEEKSNLVVNAVIKPYF